MHTIQIDRSKTLAAEPHLGHNRFHPEVSPVLEVSPGEEIRDRYAWRVRRSSHANHHRQG
jgi:formamidase